MFLWSFVVEGFLCLCFVGCDGFLVLVCWGFVVFCFVWGFGVGDG